MKERENALLKLVPFQKDMAVAEKEMFGQGALGLGGAIVKSSPLMSVLLEQMLHKALLPQAQGAYNQIVNSTAFSNDDKYIAIVTPSGIGLIEFQKWLDKQRQSNNSTASAAKNADIQTVVSISSPENPEFARQSKGLSFSNSSTDALEIHTVPNLSLSSSKEIFVLANPYFTNATSSETKNSAPFVLVTAGGIFTFIQAEPASELDVFNLNNINNRPEDKEFDLGRPVFVGEEGKLQMVVGDTQGNILFFSFPDGKLLKTVSAHKKVKGGVVSLVESPDKQTLISTGGDGLVKQWKSDGTFVETLALPFPNKPDPEFGFIRRFDFSPDGKRLFAGCEDGTIVAWDIQARKVIAQMAEKKEPDTFGKFIQRIYAVDNDSVMTFCLNNRYRIWNLNKRDAAGVPANREFQVIEAGPKIATRSVAISPSRKYALVSENVHALKLYDVATGQLLVRSEGICKYRAPFMTLTDAAYHSQGDKILAGTMSYAPLCAYDSRTLRVTKQYYPSASLTFGDMENRTLIPHTIAVPKTGTEFAVAFGSGDIHFFDLADSLPKKTLSKVWP
ncbi:MAG: hypothetical protein Q4G59_12410, partial [Planctomycetia bacterium]|nr:hypothetical protein [Planctomycetia bacterium]